VTDMLNQHHGTLVLNDTCAWTLGATVIPGSRLLGAVATCRQQRTSPVEDCLCWVRLRTYHFCLFSHHHNTLWRGILTPFLNKTATFR